MYQVSENEIINSVNSLKNNSAPGIDAIQVKTIKESLIYILKLLQYIINWIFQQGYFPQALKKNYYKATI